MRTVSQGIRKDWRRNATRTALLEKAEAMFADNGLEGVSLRQIGAAIGSGNTNVVAYYFGNKESLVEAIFEHRLPWLDGRRGELLAEAEKNGEGYVLGALVRALFLPFYEQTNSEGRHSYAGFLAALLRSGWVEVVRKAHVDFPASNEIVSRVQSLLPANTRYLMESRFRISIQLITGELQMIDQKTECHSRRTPEILFADGLQIALYALRAPVPEPSMWSFHEAPK